MTEHTSKPTIALGNAILASRALIYVVSWDEERLAEQLTTISHSLFNDQRLIWTWSAAGGFSSGPGAELDLVDPVAAINYIIDAREHAICLMLDLPASFAGNPALVRALRNAYDAFADRPGCIVMSHPQALLPIELSREVLLVNLPLPELDERLASLLETNLGYARDKRLADTWLSHLASAMRGLSMNESRDLLRELITRQPKDRDQALLWVNQARAQVLMKENCLQVIHERINISQIGGLSRLKAWMSSRQQLFSKEAREARIRAPSGILIMGVSGCGKSLSAKVIASAWNLPLIRLDMNLIMSGAWGTPESAWEQALRAVENAAPVVLWIDELENSFGFMNDTITSGNMTVFSSFLTWMQEKPDNVFVAATANKIEILPPEMIRKGRFDQLFFVDLPEKKARIEILRIHFLNQGINPYQFDIDNIANLMDGWTAAEIEQLVRSSQIDAFTQKRELVYEDIIQNIYNIVPLSKTMAREINMLRSWARDRAKPAS